MVRSIFLSTSIVFAFTLNAIADVPGYNDEPSSRYFRNWLVCGPFPNPGDAYARGDRSQSGFYIDYLESIGGETGPSIDAGQSITVGNESRTWTAYQSDDDAVYLDNVVSQAPYVLAYAYCEVQSPEDRACTLAIGSNDGIRVWLNNEEVLSLPVERGLRPDDDLVPLLLHQGKNTLLLKVAETENIWGFTCRFLPFDEKFLVEQRRYFQVSTSDDGKATLRFSGTGSLIGSIIKSVHLKVVSKRQTGVTVWEKEWSGDKEIPIDIDSSHYEEYDLNLTIAMRDKSQHALSIPFSVGKRIEHTLFTQGQSDYSIVLGEDASESERWAAGELQHWLEEAGGAKLPIINDTEPQTPQEIIVGYNKHSLTLLGPDTSPPKAMDESFTYRNAGPSIVIYGGKQRGTMYGAFTFLERELGCRWYTPSVTVIPKKEFYAFHYLDRSEAPGIQVRNDFYYEAFDPIWAARNKVNGAMSYREQPGGLECYWAVHTFYPLMPPDEFFESHPEYYSLIDGKRTYNQAQLCLTNPDVLRIVTERILQRIRENPQYLIYSVSQNDWAGACQCENCQAIAKREESESGPVLWFVNQVAEAVEKEFPDKYIGTLAYQYTRKPCKTIRPRNNVVIRLCSIECCFAHSFERCPENKSFVEDIEGWAAIAPKLYIWDYVVNFSHYIMPYPNFRALKPNLKFFRDHNAIGIMEQAAYQSRGGEFAELRAYLISKLLWNPDANYRTIIDDFMYGYYGRSGQSIRQYFYLLHGQLTEDTHIHLGLRPGDPLFSDDFIRQADAIFDQAETVADTEEIRRRVEVARLPLMYLKCKRDPQQAIRDKTYQRFTEITERENITHYAESGQRHNDAFHTEMKRVAGE